MGLFKRLFGKAEKKEPENQQYDLEAMEKKAMEDLEGLPQEDQDLFKAMMDKISGVSGKNTHTPQLFKTELYDSLNRYYALPEAKIELDLEDETGRSYPEHEAFDATFQEWQQVRSVWDRRSILFGLWDESEFDKLHKWQVIERFVKDRYPLKAVDFQKTGITQEDLQDAKLLVALSKLYRVLDYLPQALQYAQAAYTAHPDQDFVKVEYATVLHLSAAKEDLELSHQLIHKVLENKIRQDSDKDEIGLLNYFVFAPGYLDSSVFAAHFLKAGPADDAAWEALAAEYYWCPVFRFEHAVSLANSGENLRVLAKLTALADEFPWYKQGILANVDAINQMRQHNSDPAFMEEEMKRMEQYRSMWNN